MVNEAQKMDAGTLRTVERLLDSGGIDTVYRDLYLQRAGALFAPILSHEEYQALKRSRAELDEALKRSRLTVERDDWAMARDLAVRIGALRWTVEKHELPLKLGDGIYEPAAVLIDPFSSGIHGFTGWRGPSPDDALGRLAENLAALQQDDPPWRDFYAGRLAFFRAFSPAEPGSERAVSRFDTERMRREALQAVEGGDVDRLDALLERMREESETPSFPVQASGAATSGVQADLDAPFPADAVERAGRLGLAAARMEPLARLCEYIASRAWQPRFQDRLFNGEGRLQPGDIPELHGFPSDVAARLKEFIGIFMLHPFITSGGTRYLPRCIEEEVLFEDFSEDEEHAPASGLIDLLGLPGRGGLSRATIERALLRKGGWIVGEQLGLDPRIFRLVCIPCDVYHRLGKARQWGGQRLWTHFDGYQLMESGGIRSLVGGDVRYGGIFDLCSIDPDDEREGVVVRFAVVRRERMRVG